MECHPKEGHYLETNILGSVQGAGKFLDSQTSRQGEWLDRTTVSQQNYSNDTCSTWSAYYPSSRTLNIENVGSNLLYSDIRQVDIRYNQGLLYMAMTEGLDP